MKNSSSPTTMTTTTTTTKVAKAAVASSRLKLNNDDNINININNSPVMSKNNGNNESTTESTTEDGHREHHRRGQHQQQQQLRAESTISIGKENRQPSSSSSSSSSMQQPNKSLDRNPSSSNTNTSAKSSSKSSSKSSLQEEKGLGSGVVVEEGGVRLCYFDENDVMDGAVVLNRKNNVGGGIGTSSDDDGSCYNMNQDSNNNSHNEEDNENAYESNADDKENTYNDDDANDDDTDDDDDDDDDYSEASGDTVVHDDNPPPPPPTATKEELNQYYWELCYGPVDTTTTTTATAAVDTTNGSVANIMRRMGVESSAMRSSSSASSSMNGGGRVPFKSCLSTKKKRKSSNGASMTPRRILHHLPKAASSENNIRVQTTSIEEAEMISRDPSSPPTEVEEMLMNMNEDDDSTTPKNNATRLYRPPAVETRPGRTRSAVKFGNNTAAEFDFLKPITEMTPIPSSIVQRIFPSELKETEKEVEEQGVSRETARNVATLAQWDDDFDDIIDGDDDDEEEENEEMSLNSLPKKKKRGRKHTPYKTVGRKRSSGMSRPRKSRRDSSIFSRERKSLIDGTSGSSSLDDSMEMEDNSSNNNNNNDNDGNLLPFSVTIDPEEYTSPSSTSTSDSVSILDNSLLSSTPSSAKAVAPHDNEMMTMQTREARRDSACISPSSLKSLDFSISNNDGLENQRRRARRHDVNGESSSVGRDSGGSNISGISTAGRETPNSARTSSSTILRAVHASGALLPGSNSPPSQQQLLQQGGAVGEVLSSSGSGGNVRLLRPNQLKYSPSGSSSSGGSASTGRMDVSPSDSESLGSDIMSLFTEHSLDDDAESNNSYDLSKQLSLFSSLPVHPFHTNIDDLIQWIQSTQKDPVAFMKEFISEGLSPSTTLSLIAGGTNGTDSNKSMFCGNSKWLQSAMQKNMNHGKSSAFVQKGFEVMLLDEIKEIGSCEQSTPTPTQKRSITMSEADSETISSCIQQFHRMSSMDWSSMELDAAKRSLSKLEELVKTTEETENGKQFVASCCKKLVETNSMAMQHLAKSKKYTAMPSSKNTKRKLRKKRQIQSQIEGEMAEIKSLDDQLATEIDRLHQMKRAKQIFDAQLEMERVDPVVLKLAQGIRSFIVPGPKPVNLEDFTFPLLDGSAEIVAKIAALEEDEEDTTSASISSKKSSIMELGCFIRDGGTPIKLLQAILLGNSATTKAEDEILGPFPLRKSISSMILQDDENSREELFLRMTLLFFRVDMLVRSVRDIETTNGFCTVNETEDNGYVTLSVSMHHGGKVVHIRFLFCKLLDKEWPVTISPSDVKVSIVSTEPDLCLLGSQLEEKAQSTLVASSASDPILLRSICDQVMENFAASQ